MFDIYVDSSANIPDELLERLSINVIPYHCLIDGKDTVCYEKGTPFRESAREFYKKLRAGAEVKTSLIGEEAIISAVTPTLESGRDALMITIASGISGTFAQAKLAAEELNKKYSSKLYVCDSANASMGQGLLAIKAANLRDMGESCAACAKWVDDNAYKINSFFTVEDLKYLRRGGRISATLAIAGSILNIKPILTADGGINAKLAFFSRERGRKRAILALLKMFDEKATDPANNQVAITHADCEEDALFLADELKKRGVKDIIVEYYDICTGSHAGPGTLALFFTGKDRRAKSPESKKTRHGKTAEQKI